MKILFLCFHGLSPDSGVSKKIVAQVDALRQLGHEVWVCTYDVLPDGHRVRRVNGETIQDFGTTSMAALKKRCCYGAVVRFAEQHGIELAYVRSWHNANPCTISLFKQLRQAGTKVVVEIPTWPYDQEYAGLPLKYRIDLQIDRLFRRSMARNIDAFVTFAPTDMILGQRAISISNGFALNIATRDTVETQNVKHIGKGRTEGTSIRLLAVAEVHFWHGFDRAVEGLGRYHGSTPVELHIVGDIAPNEMNGSDKAPGIGSLIKKYGIEDRVVLHGALHGEALEEQFRLADFAIGSLGRHRSGITTIKTLKNREYAARGMAFCYSEQDDDFDRQAYVMRVPADESPLDIEQVVHFVHHLKMSPQEIADTVKHLSWKCQMKRVIDSLDTPT